MPANAGTVRFGSDLDQQSLTLVGPEKTTFTQTDQLAYVATLAEPANAASLRLVISKLNGTAETTLVDQPISIANPDFQVLANKFSLADLMPVLNGSGTYVMRVLRDSTLLAQGAFNLV